MALNNHILFAFERHNWRLVLPKLPVGQFAEAVSFNSSKCLFALGHEL